VVPGKRYRPEDFLEIVARRRWLIVVPFVLVAAGTMAVSSLLPNRYRSESLIIVIPQRVPESFVRSTITSEVDQRLQAISQQILSRTRLERIILDLNLYPEQRRVGMMEDIVQRMRLQDISINIARGPRRSEDSASFRVGFAYSDARTAMRVTERLASLFIEENLRDREILAEGTDQFLESQLEEARRQLLENERKLAEYKTRFMGQLPSQLQSNLQVLQNAQQQLQTMSDSLLRDRDQKVMLEGMLAEVVAQPPAARVSTGSREGTRTTTPVTAEAQLEAARQALAELSLRLKPEHPDMVRAQRAVRELEQKAAAEALKQPLSPEGTLGAASNAPEDVARARRITELRSQIGTLQNQIAAKEREQGQLKDTIRTYQARVEAAPGRESEMVSITRDYETLKERYTQLLSKREDARIAANLERRQIGEQFKVIDPARLPERPESPDRARINLMGAIAGLILGFGFAALREYRDTSLRKEDDVIVALALPVLASIPQMLTTVERARQRRRRLALSVATVVAVAIVAAAAVWKLGLLA
jgi:polysaccharide chain length determinant protein (PEP-CTERM system associated)